MTPRELANWEKIRDQMEISGKTDSFFYKRAVAICDAQNIKKLIGIITDGDLRRTFQKYPCSKWDSLRAKDFMTQDPIVISSEVFAIEALEKMEKNRKKSIFVMPVLDRNKQFLGFIRLHDLIKAGLSEK